MGGRVATTRHRFRTWLTPEQRRGLRVLAWVSVVSLVGVTLTGIWQFFTHESDPGWYGYVADSGMRFPSAPSEGVAELHSIFATAVAATALFGGAWFAYRVLYDVPWPAVIAVAVAVLGLVSGAVMRFNLVKLEGRGFDEVDTGYLQIFDRDLEFVVTSRFELGPTAIRLWTVAHVVTLPVLIAIIWLALPHADDADA